MALKDIFNPLLEEGLQKIFVSDLEIISDSVTTTDATQTKFTDDVSVALNSTKSFNILITALQTVGTGAGSVWSYKFEGAVKNIGGTTTIVGGAGVYSSIKIAEDVAASGWSVSIEANDTNDTLEVKVTGEAAKTIKWDRYCELQEITY